MARQQPQPQTPQLQESPQPRLNVHSMQTAERKKHALREGISQENAPYNTVVMQLQRQVANAYLLYTNYKHYHWQAYGPLFRDLHLLFDEFADAVLQTTDQFAERIRMIGQDPLSSPLEMVATASVQVAARKNTIRNMLAEADTNLLMVIKEMREGVRTATAQDDPGTADLFTTAVQIHEKHEWWLRDMLEKRDGLTV
jgi:starvation-inducible DNA-binding protein